MIRGSFLKRVYAIGGEPSIVAYGDCPAALGALELRHLPGAGVTADSGAIELYLLGREYPRGVRLEAPFSAHPVPSPEGITESARGAFRYMSWFGKAWSTIDRSRGRAVVLFPGIRFYNPDFAVRAVLRPLLDRMLVLRGYLPVHAAAVSAGTGCILVGEAGSGKSTLLSGLVRMGMGFLGDDRALIRFCPAPARTRKDPVKEGGRFEVRAFPEFIRLPPDARRPKRLHSPPDFSGDGAAVGVLVFLESGVKPGSGRARMERIGAAESAARLLAAVPPCVEKEHWIVLSDTAVKIAEAAESWILKGWGDPGRRLALVRVAIEKRLQR